MSHAWPDESTNKLTMLRFFLCVVNLLGALLVACPLLALYLLAVGIALEGQGVTQWWLPPLAPLSVLVLACLWVGLSYIGLMPRKLTPWGSSSTTLWLGARPHTAPDTSPKPTHKQPSVSTLADKCCVDQDNVRGFLDGGLRRFLLKSERMVAFLGPCYCTRLW